MASRGSVASCRFGAVGALRRMILDGASCDVLITSEDGLQQLVEASEFQPVVRRHLGDVETVVATRIEDPTPDVASPEALKRTVLASGAIYYADPLLATGGMHFVSVMNRLGVATALAARLHSFPTGADAMHAMAASGTPLALGFSQVTEIIHMPKLAVAGPLPAPFALTTSYIAAVSAESCNVNLARDFVSVITGSGTARSRTHAGFLKTTARTMAADGS